MSVYRILQLLRIEWATKKKLFVAIVVGAIVLTVFLCITGRSNIDASIFSNSRRFSPPAYKFHFDWFPVFLIGTGLAITSLMWYEYRKGQSRNFHLIIPATRIEKWIAKVAFYSILNTSILIFIYQILAIILNRYQAHDGILLVPLSISDPYLWLIVKRYFLCHAFMVIGASIIQRFTLIKTLIASVLLYWSIQKVTQFLIDTINGRSFLYSSSQLSSYPEQSAILVMKADNMGPTFFTSNVILLIGILCIVFSYFISYTSFKEMES